MISLKDAREQKNLTVDQLAALSNVSAATIGAVESGEQRPSFSVALKLSTALGLPMNQITELAVLMGGVLGSGVDPLLGPRVGPR